MYAWSMKIKKCYYFILWIFCSFAFHFNIFYLTHFDVFFVNILKKVIFSDSKPSPTCDVQSWRICNGYYDCPDKSDEEMCNCPSYKPFECDCYQSDDGCAGEWGCIEQHWVCDGYYNCPDKSDEEMCDCPSDYPFKCDCFQSDDGCAGLEECIKQSGYAMGGKTVVIGRMKSIV